MADVSNSFPALMGDVVTQAHTDYCAVNGHATHKIDGIWTGVCPRCGDYNTDPVAFYTELFGLGDEETVEEMTDTTGENSEMLPRATFRDVEDAEMVVECLRTSAIGIAKRGASVLKAWSALRLVQATGIPASILDGENAVTNPYHLTREIAESVTQLCGMIEEVTNQLAKLYHTPDEEADKYVHDLLDFVAETRDYAGSLVITANELNKKAE